MDVLDMLTALLALFVVTGVAGTGLLFAFKMCGYEIE